METLSQDVRDRLYGAYFMLNKPGVPPDVMRVVNFTKTGVQVARVQSHQADDAVTFDYTAPLLPTTANKLLVFPPNGGQPRFGSDKAGWYECITGAPLPVVVAVQAKPAPAKKPKKKATAKADEPRPKKKKAKKDKDRESAQDDYEIDEEAEREAAASPAGTPDDEREQTASESDPSEDSETPSERKRRLKKEKKKALKKQLGAGPCGTAVPDATTADELPPAKDPAALAKERNRQHVDALLSAAQAAPAAAATGTAPAAKPAAH